MGKSTIHCIDHRYIRNILFQITDLHRYKANESQFPVSCYIIFYDCVGDCFIIHYFIPFHYCICCRCKPIIPTLVFMWFTRDSWLSLQTLKNHMKVLVQLLSKVSKFILLRWDQSISKAWDRDWSRYSLFTIYHAPSLLLENPWKSREIDVYDIFKTAMIYF